MKGESDRQKDSRLIGYGMDSLVFHPPYFVPDTRAFLHAAPNRTEHPLDFVGLITTLDHYEKTIQGRTDLLRTLIARHPVLSKSTVLPLPMATQSDILQLTDEQVRLLIETHHAVRKNVEYQGTWKDKELVQLIYPYAGLPLAHWMNHPDQKPAWPDFIAAILEVMHLVRDLHNSGYVHGDLSPNNLLYDGRHGSKFTIVDWNMLCAAEDFLQHKKGENRVACWSPEHFSLATNRLSEMDPAEHWRIYATEMQKYIQRLIEFSGSQQTQERLRRFFSPYLSTLPATYHEMYGELKKLTAENPAAIGKYHDVRYLCDTIAKAVQGMYFVSGVQPKPAYNRFLALLHSQNLPERSGSVERPECFLDKASVLLHACLDEENAIDVPLLELTPAEMSLFDLLQEQNA